MLLNVLQPIGSGNVLLLRRLRETTQLLRHTIIIIALIISWTSTEIILDCLGLKRVYSFREVFWVPKVLVLCAVGKGPNLTLLLLVRLLRQKRAQKWTRERKADFWSIARGIDKESSSSSLLVTDSFQIPSSSTVAWGGSVGCANSC